MKRQFNLLHSSPADVSPSDASDNRSFFEEPHASHDSYENFEVTDDMHELLTRQGIVFFKNRALERMRQSLENH